MDFESLQFPIPRLVTAATCPDQRQVKGELVVGCWVPKGVSMAARWSPGAEIGGLGRLYMATVNPKCSVEDGFSKNKSALMCDKLSYVTGPVGSSRRRWLPKSGMPCLQQVKLCHSEPWPQERKLPGSLRHSLE